MNRRFQKQFSAIAPFQLGFSTIHRFCYSVLNQYSRVNHTNYTLIEGAKTKISKIQIIRESYTKATGLFPSDDKLEDILSGISFVKNMLIKPEELGEHRMHIDHFPQIYKEYEKFKHQNDLIDFDDMLTKCLHIFQNNPDILNFYRNKFDYVQMDETQDTSKVQHEIVRLLSFPNLNLFMVADDDQSIYRFRGAFPEMLLEFNDTFPKGKLYFLETNYRSSNEIINVCHSIIKENKIRYEKNIVPHHSNQSAVQITNVATLDDKCRFVADEILNNWQPDKTIAILYRNNISALPLINEFSNRGIDFFMQEKKQTFFRNLTTVDIKAFLNLSLINNDIESFERIYYKMNGFISKKAVEYLKSSIGIGTVFEGLLKNPSVQDFQRKGLMDIKAKFAYLSRLTPVNAINYIERELGYMAYLKKNCSRFGFALDSQLIILDTLKTIAANCTSTVDFLSRIDDLRHIVSNNALNIYDTPVKLMTIHSSKGLEFDKVFIIDSADNVFPNKKSVELAEDDDFAVLEEERRLFYVGLSRAKSDLHIIHTRFRNGNYTRPSKFVSEVMSGSPQYIEVNDFK